MSMRSSTEYGFGYELYTGKNDEKIVNFLKKHVDKEIYNYEKLQAYQISDSDDVDLAYDLETILGDTAEVAIGIIINHETGCNGFRGYWANEDMCPYIGYAPHYPWYMAEADKRLTMEGVTEILKKYGEELGITEEPDYFEIEYCG